MQYFVDTLTKLLLAPVQPLLKKLWRLPAAEFLSLLLRVLGAFEVSFNQLGIPQWGNNIFFAFVWGCSWITIVVFCFLFLIVCKETKEVNFIIQLSFSFCCYMANLCRNPGQSEASVHIKQKRMSLLYQRSFLSQKNAASFWEGFSNNSKSDAAPCSTEPQKHNVSALAVCWN